MHRDRMHRDSWPQIALGGLVVAAIIGGLIVTGGPWQARVEKRDLARLEDLQRLVPYVACLADRNDKTLPQTLADQPGCGSDVALADPYSGTPYRYQRLSDAAYQLCADFEAPAKVPFSESLVARFDRTTGCLQVSYIR